MGGVIRIVVKCDPARTSPNQRLHWAERPLAHYVARRRERGLRADAPRLPVAGRDLDKVARACLDACTQACWWRDDSQVAWLLVARFYADGRGECVRISAWEL